MFFYNAKIFSIKFDRVKVHHRYAERNKWVNSQHWRVVSFIFLPRAVGVQRITKLTVRIGSRFLSHGSDHFRINNNNKDNKTNVTLNTIF